MLVESAKTMVATPNTATAASILRPTLLLSGRRASTIDMASAPTAGAARRKPRPQGPACRMSRANIGSSAVAPPSSTAKRSSEIVPSMTGRLRMKETPAKTEASVTGSRLAGRPLHSDRDDVDARERKEQRGDGEGRDRVERHKAGRRATGRRSAPSASSRSRSRRPAAALEAGTMLGSSAAMVGRSKATAAPEHRDGREDARRCQPVLPDGDRQHQRRSPLRSTGRQARCAAGRTGRRHGRRRRSAPPSAGTGTARRGRARRRYGSGRRSSSPWRWRWTGRRARKKRGRQRNSDSRDGEERSPGFGICPLRCHRPATVAPAFIESF